MSTFKKITVAGSGVLGSQIAFQTAFCGLDVCVYDINNDALVKAKEQIKILQQRYITDIKASEQEVEIAFQRLSFYTDLAQAVCDADLVIEAIPENPQIKKDFYQQLAQVAPQKTIFVTNSSTLLPSSLAEYTGRPQQFAALHFANEIWLHRTAEIMGQEQTNLDVIEKITEFATAINMVPIVLKKEQAGYVLNSLLVPFLDAGIHLLVNEIADAKTIDKTWMLATGAPMGPCGIMDIVGINTVYSISQNKWAHNPNEYGQKVLDYFKSNFIDKNQLGVNTQKGFYTYPRPQYLDPDFLK